MIEYYWVINMEEIKKVPQATLQRYPLYLKALRKLKSDGVGHIMSEDLGKYVSIKSTTIRRDFSFLGNLGKQGYGYDVDFLIEKFSNELGVGFDEKIILVGVGNLGRALLNYNNWNHVVGEIVCGFDIKPENINVDIPVYNINDLGEHIPEGCRIAILTISTNVQDTVDKLVANGVNGIVNFTSEHFNVPKTVYVKSIDVVSSIQELVFETNAMTK